MRIYLILSFLVSVLTLQAQTVITQSAQVQLGLKAGFQFIGIGNQNNYGQSEMEYEVSTGIAGGLTLQYKLNSRSFLVIEALYQQQGQSYKDQINNKEFEKEIRLSYWYFPVAYRYMFKAEGPGYAAGASFGQPRWYVLGGLQPGVLQSADMTHKIDGQVTDFISFVTDGGNPNADEIEQNGLPEATDLYQDFDLVFIVGGGFNYLLNRAMEINIELRGGVGLVDINAPEWRLPNREGVYQASRTIFGGLHVGLSFRLF